MDDDLRRHPSEMLARFLPLDFGAAERRGV
jgi:hypothetical protein